MAGRRRIVCPGVTIGDDTVVGHGPVVTRDLPAGVVAVGNPARVLRELSSAGAGGQSRDMNRSASTTTRVISPAARTFRWRCPAR